MIKNEEKIGIVQALGMNGEGILKDENQTIFVPLSLPTEKIKYKVVKCNSKVNYGKLLEVFTPAENRTRPKCKVFGKCGGCQVQHLKYANQLKFKENKIETCFKKVAGLNVEVKSAVTGDSELNYRNKLQLPVGQDENGLKIGFYAENSHRIVEIEECPINALWTKDIILSLKEFMGEYNLKGYNELNRSGDIREITAKEISGNLIITLVSLKNNLPKVEKFVDVLKKRLKQDFTLYLNINPLDTNVIYGEEFRLIYGKPEYTSEMLGIRYKTGVRSFSQVNTSVCEKLYSAVKQLAVLDDNTVVIDAYSGAGLMTAILAKNAKKAIGIEIIKEAVDIANDLKKDNGLDDKIVNYLGKCEDILPTIVKKLKDEGENVVVVLDPPRKGCDYKVINALIKSEVDKIIYVSCNPSTLARDVGLLVGTLEMKDNQIVKSETQTPKYNVSYVRPFDMFAQTKHIESLTCLERI